MDEEHRAHLFALGPYRVEFRVGEFVVAHAAADARRGLYFFIAFSSCCTANRILQRERRKATKERDAPHEARGLVLRRSSSTYRGRTVPVQVAAEACMRCLRVHGSSRSRRLVEAGYSGSPRGLKLSRRSVAAGIGSAWTSIAHALASPNFAPARSRRCWHAWPAMHPTKHSPPFGWNCLRALAPPRVLRRTIALCRKTSEDTYATNDRVVRRRSRRTRFLPRPAQAQRP